MAIYIYYLINFSLVKIKIAGRGVETNFYKMKILVPMSAYYKPHHHSSSSTEGHIMENKGRQ